MVEMLILFFNEFDSCTLNKIICIYDNFVGANLKEVDFTNSSRLIASFAKSQIRRARKFRFQVQILLIRIARAQFIFK